MRRAKLVLSGMISVIVILFLILAPPYLRAGLQRDFAREWLEPKRDAWHGIIELWHVVGFKTYQGSVTSYLEQQARAYEASHPGVYFEITGMDIETANEKLEQGLSPDAWSFPLGYLYAEQLSPFSSDASKALSHTFRTVGLDDKLYAVPYLYSGYYLLGNTGLFSTFGIEWTQDFSSEWLQQVIDKASDKEQSGILSAPPILAAKLGLTCELADYASFKSGSVPLAIADARSAGDLKRALSKDGFTFEAMPIPSYTEQVQLIGVARNADAHRQKYMEDFSMYLLSEKPQSALTALGALPIKQDMETLTYADTAMQQLFDAYASPEIPNAFSYQRHAEQLKEEALRALTGDESSKAVFSKRMKDIFSSS